MATSKLSLYRGACEVLGERKIQSLTEDVPTRKSLDGVWDREGVKRCLQAGLWNFATRGVMLTYDPSYTPASGFSRVFTLPEDFVRLVSLSASEFNEPSLKRYNIDARFIFSDLDEVYLRYVSSDTLYGFDYSKWPPNFTAFVEHDFAFRICRRVTGSGRTKMEVERDRNAKLDSALSTDAAEEAAVVAPSGSWGQARGRRGRYYSTRGTPLY